MSNELKNLNLKAINAYKKQLSWGDIPVVYHMLATSLGELDGILTHGFSNPYKELITYKKIPDSFTSKARDGSINDTGNITRDKVKPEITLFHFYNENNYELHYYPSGNEQTLSSTSPEDVTIDPLNDKNNEPVRSQRLFRISNLLGFITYAFQKGDEADMQLIKFSYIRVEQLIEHLRESFEIIDIKGYNIAEFCSELTNRK